MITAVIAIAAGISAPLAASSEAQLKTAASRVVLAVVTDAQDRPLVDLGPDDFAIAENGSEREIVSVYVADYPVVVLLDEGTTATKDVQAIRSAVVRFISRLGPRAVAISTLSNPPAIVASFEDDRAAALARLEGAASNPTAMLAPLEAVSNAVHLIGETGAPFSAIVVVSARPIDTSQPAAPGLSQTIFESGAFVSVVVRRRPNGLQRRCAPDGPTGSAPRSFGPDAWAVHHGVFRGIVLGGARPARRSALDRDDDPVSDSVRGSEHGRCTRRRKSSGGPGQRVGRVEIGKGKCSMRNAKR